MSRTRIPRWPLIFFAMFLLHLIPGLSAAAPEVHGVFDGDEMFTVLDPDAIPAIRNPEYVGGDEAASQMSPAEHVMGMADGDEAVCWSTWQLDSHEIVNTEFQGTAIAAAW